MTATKEFPFLRFRGSFREIGEQYGRAARGPIHAAASGALERLIASGRLTADQARRLCDQFTTQYSRYAPHLLNEIEGIASGAGITFDEALYCRTQWEMDSSRLEQGCTSFALSGRCTSSGTPLCGQNKDVGPERIDSVVVLALHPLGRPAMINYAYWGMCEGPGFNEHGLVRMENSLFFGVRERRTVPVHLLKRLCSECTLISECEEWLARIKADGLLGLSGSMTLCDRYGRVASLEMMPGDFRVWEAPDGILAHANDPLHPDLKRIETSRADPEWSDSTARTARMDGLLRHPFLRRNLAFARQVLSDHEGHPAGICRHRPTAATVASIIAQPEEGLLHVSRGPPCENRHVTYCLHAKGEGMGT